MQPIERLKKLNTKENLWIYILILLKKNPLYAWELPSLIEKEFGFRPGNITPYRVLYRLEAENLVKSNLKDRRRTYQITEKGLKELNVVKSFYKNIIEKL
ncbi:MAG TPA: helix-turn-helix transcriptional regulator [Candidatus Pacearchaeota archaeon]|nr:helix-turn-helix transcriptional regulator [Candidatus Parcubacteria bacterium]HOC53427.1 helix-turn-helix transcriptional regulator [Candidatus Pacearchaeota archaeon]HQM24325.1 helix-turn-helix transcriptional regulator [Candidatus Pacearchaeota archaeon]